MFAFVFVCSAQLFDFAELLNALFEVLVVSDVEVERKERLESVGFAVTSQTLHLRSQFAPEDLEYQRLFLEFLNERLVVAQRRLDNGLKKHHDELVGVFLPSTSVLLPKLLDCVDQLSDLVSENLFAWSRQVHRHQVFEKAKGAALLVGASQRVRLLKAVVPQGKRV